MHSLTFGTSQTITIILNNPQLIRKISRAGFLRVINFLDDEDKLHFVYVFDVLLT